MRPIYKKKPPTLPDADQVLVHWKLPGEPAEDELYRRDADGFCWVGDHGLRLNADILHEHGRKGRATWEIQT